ncbi:MAG: IS200/IS605 family transposase [Phycisphaerae bacterium]|nr:IS200/IS605 family transposase [Phycisphaerae bacterium]NUQ46414.1 IS200/IS605 family transposase [Phycisphaerae bacterium]
MSTYTQIMYHIVFSTKNRVRCLTADRREDLFRYIWGIVKNHQCHLYRINGVEDHVHILSSLHPTVCLADLVKAIKTGASRWIRDERVFAAFTHWQDGYAAFTHSMTDKDRLIEYIRNQAEHHRVRSFEEELARLLKEAGVEYDPKYLA